MNRNTRIAIYAIIAVLALTGTWSQNLQYGPGLSGFLPDMKANPAARSVTVDIFLMALSAAFLMVYEARRVGVRFVWAYVFFGFTVAISVTFPLFLIAREFALGKSETARPVGLAAYDYVGLVLAAAAAGWLTWYTLFA
ncbi:MAG TPA: DUF2834 domain-containing protein [Rhizomicrobium sp.]|jgi:hypothetical protein|nr:DUF2834 domain-containing protein [Rhizomicrobium sp.]